jgi:hypothetical protein
MVVPYFDSTDHLVFCDSIIGVPGVTLTNWPDEYIHSSDDNLWNIDPTQLKRNAFIVAASALYLANADDARVPQLAAEVYGRALERISRDMRTAMHLIETSPRDGLPQAYKIARNLIHQASLREQKAVNSISVFAKPNGENKRLLDALAKSIASREEALVSELNGFYRAISGSVSAPSLELSERERALVRRIPRKVGTVAEYIEASNRVRSVDGLHSLMEFEILNFVDGKNSCLNIFNAVSAESLSAGEFYYGRVTLEAVEQYLNNAAEAKTIVIEQR